MDPASPAATPSTASRMPLERERQLVAGARGHAAAFAELYDIYLPRIYGFIYRRVLDRSTAEDLTAATFHRALEAVRSDRFRNDSFGGWLYRVAANAVVDHIRIRRRVLSIDQTDGGGTDAALEAFAAALDRDELRRALLRLPDGHRQVLVLRFFDDLDIDELCGIFRCSRKTFAVKLHRAVAALRAVMSTEVTDAA